jgi:mRNA interferase RelE/StbE
VKVSFTKLFKQDYQRLPIQIQELINKQIDYLMENPHHPSLHIKKMEGHGSIWEARITKGYRMTFQIHGDLCLLRRVGTHSILKRP